MTQSPVSHQTGVRTIATTYDLPMSLIQHRYPLRRGKHYLWDEADERAWDLLARTIGAEATSQLAESGHFTLRAHGYTFDVIRDGPIQVLAPRHMVCHLCVVPKERLPWPDSLLLQYLLCRYDPSRLWRSARVLRVRNPRTGRLATVTRFGGW